MFPSTSRKTLDKALTLLMQFSHENKELAISELAERVGMHKSVVSRFVSSLCAWEMLEVNPVNGRLRIGASAFRIGSLFSHRNELAELGMPLLAQLVHKTKHSAHLSILVGVRILVIAAIEGPDALRVIMRVGDQRHLHATAAGKVFLAFSEPSLLGAISSTLQDYRLTENTLISPDDLMQALPSIRRTNRAKNNGETHRGVGAAASGVFSEQNNLIAAISTIYPLNIMNKEEEEQIAEHTLFYAESLSSIYRERNVYGNYKAQIG
mgnify:CR=1 FL=1